MTTLTIVSVIVIIIMLLLAYGSVARALIPLLGVLIILATARGVVSFLVAEPCPRHLVVRDEHACRFGSGCSPLTTAYFLSADTTKHAGQDRTKNLLTTRRLPKHRTSFMGSGLAISGATLCLSLTKLNYFRTLGPPCFVGMVVAVLARSPSVPPCSRWAPISHGCSDRYHLAQCGAN